MAELIYKDHRLLFTEEMKRDYTILLPQMAPFHFDLLEVALRKEGFKTKLLDNEGKNIAAEGIKYVHNDSCYPAILVIGQMIDAIKHHLADSHKIAVLITQTGGGCRASNYIHLLRKALAKADLGHIPVISLNISKLEENPGFKPSYHFWIRAMVSVLYGDLIQMLYNKTKPYECFNGSAERATERAKCIVKQSFDDKWLLSNGTVKRVTRAIIDAFKEVETKAKEIPKVGIVGEIYVKFSSIGNNNLEDMLRAEDCEIILLPLMDFVLFKLDYRALEVDWYGGKKIKKIGANALINYIEKKRALVNRELKAFNYGGFVTFSELKSYVDGIISRGNRMGEGWLLTAEMIELIRHGAPNIVCTQPFGCLPNHISGKGVFKILRDKFPMANIVAIDYDPGASEVNQKNRIKLMLANAKGILKGKKPLPIKDEREGDFVVIKG